MSAKNGNKIRQKPGKKYLKILKTALTSLKLNGHVSHKCEQRNKKSSASQ